MAQTGDTGQTSVDTTYVFTTNEKFATREAVVEWARELGIANRVSIIITRSDKKTGKRGRNDKLILGCDKGGKYEVENSTITATKKCSCPFKIRATPSTDGSGWKVQVKCGVHNHRLPDQYEGHSRVGRLTADEKKHVADLTKRHVAPRHILLSLKEQNPESVTHITQIYKNRSIQQKEKRGSRTEMQQLLQVLDDAKYVSWNRRRDDDSDVLSDIFWAHTDSIKLLNMFPIVLIMDITYKTNKYRQPLLEIVGITSTELTFSVGFGYMECEKMDNYCWVLEKLKGLFIKQDLFPHVILTDREFVLMNAIQIVFPHTVNLLCVWHINKKVSARCSVHVAKDMRELVINLWKNVVSSPDEVEYQQRLNAFVQACANSSKFVDYVKNTWLTPHRQRFVEAWTNRVMHLGNTTSNRVEYSYWKLKQMLKDNQSDLCKCLEAMNDNITIQVGNIKASFQKSFYYKERLHNNPFFQNLRSFVSRAAMTLIAAEFGRVGIVGTDKNICGCTLRSTCGLPCACELGGYSMSGVPIPLDSVHGHWKKLTMEGPLEDDTKDGYELDMTRAMDALWSRFRSLDIIGKRALKSKVFELAYPASLTSQKYLVQFSKHIHPHIVDIIEVVADGNCGFRAIASLLGYTEDGWPMVRRELDNELRNNNSLYEKLFGERIHGVRDSLQISGLGVQLEDRWFTIPAMGYLVANRYNVILVTLGKPSTTFFPMMTPYSSSARFFCIGYVGGNHWVQVNMKPGFPLPDVTADWKKFRSLEATSWMSKLTERLQYWQHLNYVKPPIGVIEC